MVSTNDYAKALQKVEKDSLEKSIVFEVAGTAKFGLDTLPFRCRYSALVSLCDGGAHLDSLRLHPFMATVICS